MPEASEIIAALLQQRTPISFIAGGPSMNPTIRDGESVFIKPLPTGAILLGGVILYRIYGRLTVHRCTFNNKRTNRIYTVGDAAVKGGDWIPAADILGVAESVRRDGRIHRLDTRRARWAGLLRFALRPLRRLAGAVHRRLFRPP
jgi:signal peptidase I